jgi:hypothetical protein
MKFDKFLGKLENGRVVNESRKLNEEFESNNWFYVPDKEFLGGTMKVAVEELGSDKWQIHYFAPSSGEEESSLSKARAAANETKTMEKYMQLSEKILKEEKSGNKGRKLNEGENDTSALEDWKKVTSTDELDFATALEKCVALVEGNVDSSVEQQVKQYTQE